LEAIEDIGIIPRYGGVVVHDCWQSYLSYKHCSHGLRGSHLLRELTFIVESNGYAWASNIKRLLQENCAIVSRRPSKQLTEQEYKNQQKRYRNIMTRGEKALPPILPKQKGCFRTKKYAHAYCRISSYLQTIANKGYNPLVAIQMASAGQIYTDRGE
jgi:transposase